MTPQDLEIARNSRGARLAAATLAFAALLFALAASSAGAAPAPKTFWGVAPQTPLTDADFDRMGQGNVGTVRIALFWSEIDPSPAAGDSNWAPTDAIFAAAARNGVQVLPFVYGTPSWVAQGLEGRNCAPAKCALSPPKKKAGLEAWKGFLKETEDRYGPNGSFWAANPGLPRLPLSDYQIWNEQNSKSFFTPKPSPKLYAKLLAASADVLRSEDPGADIVLGGMAELAGSKKAIAATEYLEGLYRVKGVEKNFDAVAIHPYGASVKKVADQVEAFRKVMKKSGDSGAGLWVTEVGAGSANGGNPLNRGLKGQASLLKQTFKYFKKNRNKLNIEGVQWFSWMDSKVSIYDWCKTSGLFKSNLRAKPSWKAFTKFTGGS